MKTLKQKLATVAAAVQTVGKGGYNENQKYNYVRAADVVRKIREELLNEGLIVSVVNKLISATPCKTNRGGDATLTTLELAITFHDVDSTETLTSVTLGQGWDTNDKGIAKAMTMAYKYSLIEPFMVEMTDDPEADANADELTSEVKGSPASRPVLVLRPVESPPHKCVGDENGYCVTCSAVLGDMANEPPMDEPTADLGRGKGASPQTPKSADALPSTCLDCNRKLYTTYAPSNKEHAGKPLRDSKGRAYARCAACGTMWYADGTGYNPKTKEKK